MVWEERLSFAPRKDSSRGSLSPRKLKPAIVPPFAPDTSSRYSCVDNGCTQDSECSLILTVGSRGTGCLSSARSSQLISLKKGCFLMSSAPWAAPNRLFGCVRGAYIRLKESLNYVFGRVIEFIAQLVLTLCEARTTRWMSSKSSFKLLVGETNGGHPDSI